MEDNWTPAEGNTVIGGPPALSQKSFGRFANYITSELGIKMPDSKITMVQGRLMRRARELELRSIDEYGDYFFTTPSDEEREYIINAITTNKTDFFREPEHFDYLVKTALPTLRAEGVLGTSRLNVWSAGCSSGQEPYTLAMILNEHGLQNAGFIFGILATDISTKVLEQAKRGMYDEALADPVPTALRKQYLLRGKGSSSGLVRVSPALRGKVSFHQLNFMDESYPLRNKFDIVFCRNVLIYFDRDTQERVLCNICRHINPGGYLFLGHSESPTGMNIPAYQVSTAVFRLPTSGERR